MLNIRKDSENYSSALAEIFVIKFHTKFALKTVSTNF